MNPGKQVDVVVPVYNGFEHVRRCLESVLAWTQATAYELLVVDDASSDARLTGYLDELAAAGRVTLLRNPENQGFVHAVNRGMALHPERDVVLLNSDTEVANDWLDRLRACVHSQDDIATATPFSNNATICSFPAPIVDNPPPSDPPLAALDATFRRVNAGRALTIPTAVGFCMYIRRACLGQVGLFDADAYGRGYGEENDFCMRAESLGWRHVLCADTYVLHRGAASFAAERETLVEAAAAILRARYPEYPDKVAAHIALDPAAPLRRAVEIALARPEGAGAVGEPGGQTRLHLLHDWGGGAAHWLEAFCAADEPGRNLVLKPFSLGGAVAEGLQLIAGDAPERILGVWRFREPLRACAEAHDEYRRILADILAEHEVGALVVSSLIGHSLDALDSELPTLLVAHDYYPVCAAINLYFGGVCAACDDARLAQCARENSDFNPADLALGPDAAARLRARFLALACRPNVTLVTPTHATRRHLQRIAPALCAARFVTLPHGIGRPLEPLAGLATPEGRRLRVMVLGMLSVSKGARLLDAVLARLTEFADVYLVGARELGDVYQHRDGVRVINEYRPEDLRGLVAELAPDVGLLLSIWPETYSYTLSELIMLGVPPVASNLGAFAERIVPGYTGYLFEPDAEALLACLRGIDARRADLERIRAHLRALPRRGIAEMLDDYRALAPLAPSGRGVDAPTVDLPLADADLLRLTRQNKTIKSLGLSLDINRHERWRVEVALREQARAARHEIETMSNQLDHTTRALGASEARLHETARTLHERELSLQEAVRHARAVEERNREFVARIDDLARHVQALSRHAEGLRTQLEHREAEIREIVASTSWRVTHPLRWFGNNLRRARRVGRFALTVLREPRIWWPTVAKLYRTWRVGGWPALKQKLSRPPEDAQFQNEWLEYRKQLETTLRPVLTARLAAMPARPRLSILLPTYNTPAELLRQTLDSVLGQIYPEWELCVADDASPKKHVQAILREYAARDRRIKLHIGTRNRGVAHASNRALELATGEMCILLDHDDLLEPQALSRVAETLAAERADVVYSDEALVSEDARTLKFLAFRPAFAPEYLRSHPYIVHLAGIRTELLRAIGGFDEDLSISQDYDLFLRATERAERIVHIPEILYLWRIHDTSSGHEKMLQVMATSRGVLTRHLERLGEPGWVEDGPGFNFFSTRYPLAEGLRVAIVIPTKNHGELVRQCIDSIRRTVRQAAYDIVVVDHESDDPGTLEYFTSLAGDARVIRYVGPFNFSAINNWAVDHLPGATYSHYLLCNNDIEAIHEGWLERMLELGQKADVGIVGAKLFYPDRRTIQHAGVCVGGYGAAEHYAKQMVVGDPRVDLGYFGRLSVNQELSAVTAACLLIRADTFAAIRGFDEQIAVGFGDVDLCLRALQAGWRILYCGHAELVHHESYTRGTSIVDPHPEDSAYFMKKWRAFLDAGDPYYNPNLDAWNMAWAYKRPLTPKADVGRRVWSARRGEHRQGFRLVPSSGDGIVTLG